MPIGAWALINSSSAMTRRRMPSTTPAADVWGGFHLSVPVHIGNRKQDSSGSCAFRPSAGCRYLSRYLGESHRDTRCHTQRLEGSRAAQTFVRASRPTCDRRENHFSAASWCVERHRLGSRSRHMEQAYDAMTATPNHALQRTPGFGVQLPGAALIRPAQSRAVRPAIKPGTARAFALRRRALSRAPGPESLSLGSLGVLTRLSR